MLNNLARAFATAWADQIERHLLTKPRWVDIIGTRSLESLDVRKFAQVLVAFEAAEFYCKYLYNADFYDNYQDHVREMARRATKLGPGAFLEFGVATGTTITLIAEVSERPVVGFDWFEGLPENWREGVKAGAFAGTVPHVPTNVLLEIGLIEHTLPAWLARNPPAEINFIHIDTDLYKPANTILSCCAPYIRNAIVVFDEFYNYPGWRDHEYKAFCEFQEHHPEFEIKYLGAGGAVAVSAQVVQR